MIACFQQCLPKANFTKPIEASFCDAVANTIWYKRERERPQTFNPLATCPSFGPTRVKKAPLFVRLEVKEEQLANISLYGSPG